MIAPTVSGSHASQALTPRGNPTIKYHGGPVLGTVPGQPVHLYYIFYGNWAGLDSGGPAIMTNFASSLGGSSYWNILTTYIEPNSAFIQNALTLNGTYYDSAYSQGTSLTDSTLQKVVQNAISKGLALDSNGIYLVASTPDVTETSGFCSQYCGFHTHMTYNGTDIKYAFIGDPVACTAQGGVADCQGESSNITKSPNNDPGVDAMISIIAHESEEATSDPDLNAWYFNSGNENGDQCAYLYGTVTPLSNGSVYNVTLGGHQYLIQEDYVAPNKGCAISH